MKSNYEARAIKFAHVLARMFEDCETLQDYKDAVFHYNMTHSRRLVMFHGVSRIAIVRSDYVIKCDYVSKDRRWSDGQAGNNESEAEMYDRAVEDGFEYLLAKSTLVNVDGKEFSIMPRIAHVDDWDRDWYDYCTEEEYDWLDTHICDLHNANVGYRKGKVCVIDYAWAW